ncbi:MAG: ATP-dependent Clp protease adaptor ClpS, partial [Bacteroidetes bacterium]|nr:ATP-dependent Clp protease adaptor ClpS [Bacteroidota bacterium]
MLKQAEQVKQRKKTVSNDYHIVLYNDDVNTFDFVIES